MSRTLGLSESSHLTQKLQDASQNLVATHGSVDLACGHKEGNQHGDKEPTEPSQALKKRWRQRGPSSEPGGHSMSQGSWATPNSPCPVPAAAARPSEVPHHPSAPRLSPAQLTAAACGTQGSCPAEPTCYSGGWEALGYLWERGGHEKRNPHNILPFSSTWIPGPAYHPLGDSALGTRQSAHCS